MSGKTKPDTRCRWTEDDEGNWHTACGGIYVLINGTPRENDMRWCCYCGGALREQRAEDGEERG